MWSASVGVVMCPKTAGVLPNEPGGGVFWGYFVLSSLYVTVVSLASDF